MPHKIKERLIKERFLNLKWHFFTTTKKDTVFFYGFTVIEERNKGSRLVIKKIHEEKKLKIYKNELQEL